MKVLIIVSKTSAPALIVKLHTKVLIDEVKALIGEDRRTDAIMAAIGRGRLEREIPHHEIYEHDADLILSENGVSWDIKG